MRVHGSQRQHRGSGKEKSVSKEQGGSTKRMIVRLRKKCWLVARIHGPGPFD
jgi:hypothetical protein